MAKLAKYDDDIPDGSGWAETRDLKPLDKLLRKHGFSVYSRPSNGPVIWTKDGERLTQEDALLTLPPKEVATARGDDVVPTVLPLTRTRY